MTRQIETSDVLQRAWEEPGLAFIEEETARSRPIAPENIDTSHLDEALVDEEGRPVSVGDAIDTYLPYQRTDMNTQDEFSRPEYARNNQYPRILEGDRGFQEEYGLTTATFTRRLSPLSEGDELLTPWEMSEQLHGGGRVHDAIWNAIDYQLGDREYEWAGVTTPTDGSGAPQEHLHYWIDDPGDEIRATFFETARDKHLEYVPNALGDDHTIREDGGGGTVQVSTDPPKVDSIPEEFASIYAESDYPPRRPTRSAHFVATQLADLVVWDYYDGDEDNPSGAELEGAAAGWAVPHEWFRTSSGMPAAADFPGG